MWPNGDPPILRLAEGVKYFGHMLLCLFRKLTIFRLAQQFSTKRPSLRLTLLNHHPDSLLIFPESHPLRSNPSVTFCHSNLQTVLWKITNELFLANMVVSWPSFPHLSIAFACDHVLSRTIPQPHNKFSYR